MLISRRNFFRISALPVLASFAPSVSLFGQSADVFNDRLMTLRSGDFCNQIGTKFKLTDGGLSRQAVLTDVKKFASSGANQFGNEDSSDLKCFSLTFRLIGSMPAEQATFTVKHGILGDFQLFLVPGKLSASQPILTAVVNRSF